MTTAELLLVPTSDQCTCYRLKVDCRIVWRTRAFTDKPESHQGARDRMAAWCLKHGVEVVEAKAVGQVEPAPQRVIAGRYGRH